MKKTIKILFVGLIIAVIAASCNDTEIYITNQNNHSNVVASCDSTVLRMLIYQDNILQTDFSTMIINDRICFRTMNTENIDFDRDVILRLEVFRENSSSSCRFKKNITYGTSNIRLRKVNSVLRIFEADIMSFYPVE